jgi:hypothetical protein
VDPAGILRDALLAAQANVLWTESQLDAACERLRNERPRSQWLAGNPDLLRLDRVIQDLARRQECLTRAEAEYQRRYDERLRMAEAVPFQAPTTLDEEIAACHLLLEALASYASSELLLRLVGDRRFRPDIRAVLQDRVASIGRAIQSASREDYRGTTRWHKCYKAEMTAADARASGHRRPIADRLRHVEAERDRLAAEHASQIRASVDADLTSLKGEVDAARSALTEATDALASKGEVDRFVADCLDSYVAEQTRDLRAAHDAAVRACDDLRCQVIAEFRSRLATGFLAVRVEDFAPPNDLALAQE